MKSRQAHHVHTPRVITNQNNTVVWQWNSDPFGSTLPNENPAGQGSFTCNMRFSGQYYDRETNLHYNYFRDYDPSTGRYIQSDPIGLEGGTNTYAYVDGNPRPGFDPTGLANGAAANMRPSGSCSVSGGDDSNAGGQDYWDRYLAFTGEYAVNVGLMRLHYLGG